MLPSVRRTSTRTAALLAAAAGVAAVSACASTGSTAAANGSSASAGIKSIAFVNPLPNNATWHQIGQCMADEAKKVGIPFTETGPTGTSLNPTSMISSIQQAIANKKGAIVTFPADGPLFAPVAQQAKDAHIPFVTVQGSADGAETTQVGVDWEQWGRLNAQEISKLGGKQIVGTISVNSTPPSSYWVKAMTDEAKKLGNVSIVVNEYDNGDATKDAGIVSAMLRAHPDLTVITTPEGSTIPSAVTAIREAGKAGKLSFFPYGFANGGKEGIADGTVWKAATFNLCGTGQLVVQTLAKIGKGESVPKVIGIPIKFVTKDNLDEVVKEGLFE